MYSNSKSGEQGFSMLEILIASLVLLIITLGVVPLFGRSIANNVAGSSSLLSINIARSTLEELRQLPFDSPRLTIPNGSTELQNVDYWSQRDKVWKDGQPPGDDPARWLRTTTIRQFSLGDFKDDGQFNDPKSGDTAPEFVHIKEIEVIIESGRTGGPFGAGKSITLKHLKTF